MSETPTESSRFAWIVALVDDGGPFALAESDEDEWFPTIDAAIESAKGLFEDIDEAEIIQVFEHPGTSYTNLVAGWSPTDGLWLANPNRDGDS